MGWWDELEASLTARLDDFLRANPDVAAEMERDTLAEQETQTRQLLQQLRGETQKLEQKILATGEQIRLWHGRLKLAEQAGRQDFIQGLPGHTLEQWELSLHKAVEAQPKHISVYDLTLEPKTRFYRDYPEDSPA